MTQLEWCRHRGGSLLSIQGKLGIAHLRRVGFHLVSFLEQELPSDLGDKFIWVSIHTHLYCPIDLMSAKEGLVLLFIFLFSPLLPLAISCRCCSLPSPPPFSHQLTNPPTLSLNSGEGEVGVEMPFRRVLPAPRQTTSLPRGGASFRTTLSDSAAPHPHPLYGETDDYDDIDSALAFDDDMCITIEQHPFQHGTNHILTISNACLAASSDVLSTSPTSEVAPTITNTAAPPKRVFSSFSIRQKPAKRPRLQESRSPYPAEVIYDPSTDFFIIASTPTSQTRAYSPSDVMGNGRRPRAKSSPSAASRRVLQAAMRPIVAIKRRYGAAMGTRKGDSMKEKGSMGLGMGMGMGMGKGKSRGTKCVVVGT
jgi:hypothetical protein